MGLVIGWISRLAVSPETCFLRDIKNEVSDHPYGYVHWSHFLEDSSALRPGLAAGKYDASLLLPRGVRDEEFHTAVCELPSDWGSTVADPEVEAVRVVGDPDDTLTLALRDLLVRMGMPHRVHPPDSDIGQEITAAYDGPPTLPLVDVLTTGVIAVRSTRELAAAFYGRPDQIDDDKSTTVAHGSGRHDGNFRTSIRR